MKTEEVVKKMHCRDFGGSFGKSSIFVGDTAIDLFNLEEKELFTRTLALVYR
jgi:hypothetical protein